MSSSSFLDLERPEHAYLFGFLQGDGTLKKGTGQKGQLRVELSARDARLLEEFQALVPFYSSIRTRTRNTNFADEYTSVIWTLCALETREWLQQLGLPVGRKDDKIAPPTVPFSENDYLRGLVDADGSVGMTALGLPFVSLTTSSTPIRDFFLARCPPLPGRPRTVNRNRRDAVFNPMATRECAVELATALYYEHSLAVVRKARAAVEVSQWTRPQPRRTRTNRWSAGEDRVALNLELEQAALRLGRTRSAVYLRRRLLVRQRLIVDRALALRHPRFFYEPL